jgi:hypothetical protein
MHELTKVAQELKRWIPVNRFHEISWDLFCNRLQKFYKSHAVVNKSCSRTPKMNSYQSISLDLFCNKIQKFYKSHAIVNKSRSRTPKMNSSQWDLFCKNPLYLHPWIFFQVWINIKKFSNLFCPIRVICIRSSNVTFTKSSLSACWNSPTSTNQLQEVFQLLWFDGHELYKI